ncbi:MAG: hypothetical protein AAGC55_07455 [Myxococcota bacterium]
MSRLSNSPRLHKGAIVSIASNEPTPTVVAFQYNPETMKRTFSPKKATADSSKEEQQRIDEPPAETITLKAEFDATDGIEVGDPIAVSMGVYPQLSALEILMYPPLECVTDNDALITLGNIEIIPPRGPLILFVWGANRVLPVQLDSLSIDEKAYDERLNPIQAEVDLTLRVLSHSELPMSDAARFISLSHQSIKQAMGLVGTANSIISFI